MWCHRRVIPALERLRQEDHEFKVILEVKGSLSILRTFFVAVVMIALSDNVEHFYKLNLIILVLSVAE